MTKKKQPKEPEPDYSEFCIRFTTLCMNLSIKFIKLVYTLFKYTYKRIQVYLAWRALQKDVRECAACRDYFQEHREYFDRHEVK